MIVAPSILSADFSKLLQEVKKSKSMELNFFILMSWMVILFPILPWDQLFIRT